MNQAILHLNCYTESFYVDVILDQNKFTILSWFLVKDSKNYFFNNKNVCWIWFSLKSICCIVFANSSNLFAIVYFYCSCKFLYYIYSVLVYPNINLKRRIDFKFFKFFCLFVFLTIDGFQNLFLFLCEWQWTLYQKIWNH